MGRCRSRRRVARDYRRSAGRRLPDAPARRRWRRRRGRGRCSRRARPRATRGDHAGRIERGALRRRALGRRRRGDAGEPRQRRLARPAGQERHAERRAARCWRASSSRFCGRALAEADAGIGDDAVAGDAGGSSGGDALAQEGQHLGDDVVVARLGLHRAGVPRMCIRQTPHDGCAATTSSAPGARSARDVVDDVGAERRAPRASPPAWLVSTETGQPRRTASAQHRQRRAPARSSALTGSRAGPARLAADVEDVGALAEQLLAVRDGARPRVSDGVAVGERIGRDVDDAHHARPRRGRCAKRPVCQIIGERSMKNGAEAPSSKIALRDMPQAAARRVARRDRRHVCRSA